MARCAPPGRRRSHPPPYDRTLCLARSESKRSTCWSTVATGELVPRSGDVPWGGREHGREVVLRAQSVPDRNRYFHLRRPGAGRDRAPAIAQRSQPSRLGQRHPCRGVGESSVFVVVRPEGQHREGALRPTRGDLQTRRLGAGDLRMPRACRHRGPRPTHRRDEPRPAVDGDAPRPLRKLPVLGRGRYRLRQLSDHHLETVADGSYAAAARHVCGLRIANRGVAGHRSDRQPEVAVLVRAALLAVRDGGVSRLRRVSAAGGRSNDCRADPGSRYGMRRRGSVRDPLRLPGPGGARVGHLARRPLRPGQYARRPDAAEAENQPRT